MKSEGCLNTGLHALARPITPPRVLLWIALTGLAYAGNALSLPLFFSVDFLFGSIPLFVVLHLFGWAPAVLSTLIASTHTAMLWGHPYAVIIMTAEILLVGLFYRRKSRNLVLLDVLFWIAVGMPLVFLFYRSVMDVALQNTLLVMFKQAINGLFNALVGTLIVTTLDQTVPSLKRSPLRVTVGFQHIIFLVMVAVVLIPGLVILVVFARQEMGRIENDVRGKIEITSFSAKQAVNAWLVENLQTLRSLASYADPISTETVRTLRVEMALLKMSNPDFAVMAVSDSQGRVLVGEPYAQASQLLDGLDLAAWPYFARMIDGMQGVASNAVIRGSESSVPVVILGVPLIERDQSVGAVLGVLDTDRLGELLDRVVGSWTVDATIIDARGIVLASTSAMVEPFSSYAENYPQDLIQLSPTLYLRTPEFGRRVSVMERWQDSEYTTLERIGPTAPWRLSLNAAIAPYQDALNERYRSMLFVMLTIVAGTIILSAMLSRRVLGSLIKLTAVAEDLPSKLTQQDQLDWPSSKIDEIATLIKCFRITGDHLSDSFLRLQAANRELELAKQGADSANRTKSQFLANISHDLRTPLNGILGYAQILSNDASLSEKTRNAINIIEKSGNHLLNLINDILDVSRIEADKLQLTPEPFYLPAFLSDIADIVTLQARRKGLRLHTEIAEDLPAVVVGDEKRLRQVLLNLLNNAVKFTEAGDVHFRASGAGEAYRFEVEDTGLGIPPDALEEIFSPFKQLTKHIQSEEGTGLGLAIVQRLVRMMGGQVAVESEPNKGSRFYFTVALPASDETPSGDRVSHTITGFRGGLRVVLVVDDKWENRSVIRGMLEPLGFTLYEAVDGADSIEVMRRVKPDLVFMDLVMPNMDGFGAVREIRESDDLHDTRVVAISASVASTIRDECLRVGFNDFIPKPFREIDLLDIVRQQLGVEWVHAPSAEAAPEDKGPSVIPWESDLAAIRVAVAKGSIRGIIESAQQLAGDHPDYQEFCDRIVAMANEFQINRIDRYLSEVSKHNG